MSRHPIAIAEAALAETSRNLTASQIAFVEAYVANGGQGAQAAQTAGYAAAGAAGAASKLIRKPLIQQAIVRETLKRIGLLAVPALATIERLSMASRSDYVRLEAARDLLDRAGFRIAERVERQLDADLTVQLNLAVTGSGEGAPKHAVTGVVTGPRTGKSAPEDAEIVDSTSLLLPEVDPSWSKEGAPGGPGGAAVDFSTEEVDFPTIPLGKGPFAP